MAHTESSMGVCFADRQRPCHNTKRERADPNLSLTHFEVVQFGFKGNALFVCLAQHNGLGRLNEHMICRANGLTVYLIEYGSW